jgi:hypothetical protein
VSRLSAVALVREVFSQSQDFIGEIHGFSIDLKILEHEGHGLLLSDAGFRLAFEQ